MNGPDNIEQNGKDTHVVVDNTTNPYYGGPCDMGAEDIVVHITDNPYYAGDVALDPETQTIQNTDNPYYDMGMDSKYPET